jgi:hypothetical protein
MEGSSRVSGRMSFQKAAIRQFGCFFFERSDIGKPERDGRKFRDFLKSMEKLARPLLNFGCRDTLAVRLRCFLVNGFSKGWVGRAALFCPDGRGLLESDPFEMIRMILRTMEVLKCPSILSHLPDQSVAETPGSGGRPTAHEGGLPSPPAVRAPLALKPNGLIAPEDARFAKEIFHPIEAPDPNK